MKSAGTRRPRVGWCHRINASAPATRPSDSRIFGWRYIRNCPSSIAGRTWLTSFISSGLCVSIDLVVDLEPRPGLLRRVHRDVRVTEQRVGILGMVRVERDPDARRDVQVELVDPDRMVETVHQPFGDRDRGGVVGDVAHEDTELVAAETRHQVLLAEGLGEPRSDRREQLVADVVTQRVVDLLEVIEVHQHHREAARLRGRFLDRLTSCRRNRSRLGRPVR